MDGIGTSISHTKALKYFKKAAKQDNIGAQHNYGKLLERNGKPYKAFKWFVRAAEKGNCRYSQHRLGELYLDGIGVENDDSTAFEWFQRAANQEYSEAQLALARMYFYGQGVSRSLKKSFEWALKAATSNENGRAQYETGLNYLKGCGVEPSTEEALKFLRKAADNEDADAQLLLSGRFHDGGFYEQAFKWYNMSAEKGNILSQYNIGVMYKKGIGVAQSYSKSAEWYEKGFYKLLLETDYLSGKDLDF
ncbi:predicted protein [Naegleria gruberi]|uniref:Predicted protein n=1 Tax=Naegleria gruberi TaxID=5762 RepID=D2VFB4_NAEGR|nr:uncharacterized protein NAEGRDRAFT_33665 [Naegleria gruberi]EFC44340.1 predicted protein [Naegleria gruberi]|eukprot:XP_002677084.1 predicted protein [Naegleria gruberi strain NEG-M]